jgi:SPP1 gp7 family putative phage head morphogenesis protein
MPSDEIEFTLRQAIRLRRLENAVAAAASSELQKYFDELLENIIKQNPVVFQLDTTKLFVKISSQVKRDAVSIAFTESKKAAAALLDIGGNELPRSLSVARLKQIYEGDAIQGLTVDQWFAHNRRKLEQRIRVEIATGRAKGETAAQIKARVQNNAISPSVRQIEALSRTATNNLHNAAIWETGEANPKLTRGYRLIVTFDRRTSQICIAYGKRNQVYPYAPSSPRPPFHFGCRTLIQPVLIGDENKKPVDAGDWLKRQDKKLQDEILGPRRADLFRRGKLDLSELIRSDGSLASLAEIRGVAASFQI